MTAAGKGSFMRTEKWNTSAPPVKVAAIYMEFAEGKFAELIKMRCTLLFLEMRRFAMLLGHELLQRIQQPYSSGPTFQSNLSIGIIYITYNL